MRVFWMKFTDGSSGYCEGMTAYHAVSIAEKMTGKKADVAPENKWNPEKGETVKSNPYPVSKMIWQFDDPVHGKCPGFCYRCLLYTSDAADE